MLVWTDPSWDILLADTKGERERKKETDYWSTYIIWNSKLMGTGWRSGIQSYLGDRGENIMLDVWKFSEDTTNDI